MREHPYHLAKEAIMNEGDMSPNIGPIWSPRGGQHLPKWTFEIGAQSPFFGFNVGKLWKTDLGPFWDAFWGHLGAILGHLGAILGHLGAILEAPWAI